MRANIQKAELVVFDDCGPPDNGVRPTRIGDNVIRTIGRLLAVVCGRVKPGFGRASWADGKTGELR
jgi:hypothetical protein